MTTKTEMAMTTVTAIAMTVPCESDIVEYPPDTMAADIVGDGVLVPVGIEAVDIVVAFSFWVVQSS